MLGDKVFYPLAAVLAGLLIAFSTIWPQGIGSVSPAPFGHAIVLPDYYRMARERDARHVKEAADRAVRQAQAASSAAASASSAAASTASTAP